MINRMIKRYLLDLLDLLDSLFHSLPMGIIVGAFIGLYDEWIDCQVGDPKLSVKIVYNWAKGSLQE